MEDYITGNISAVNKHNQLYIKLGIAISENIFNNRICKKTLNTFLLNLTSKKIITNQSVQKYNIYSNANSVTEINSKTKNKNHYSYIYKNHQIEKYKNVSMLIYIEQKLNYDDSLTSIYNYNNIQECECVNIDIYNLFTVQIQSFQIKDNEDYATISIIIKKPNDYNKLICKIKEICELL